MHIGFRSGQLISRYHQGELVHIVVITVIAFVFLVAAGSQSEHYAQQQR